MPQEPNKALRSIVVFALFLAGIGLLAIFLRSGSKPATPTSTPTASPSPVSAIGIDTTPQATTPPTPAPTAVADKPEVRAEPINPQPQAETTLVGLRAQAYPNEGPYLPLGDVDQLAEPNPSKSPTTMRLEFSRIGAGIESLRLASHYTAVTRKEHVRLQSQAAATIQTLSGDRTDVITPMAALAIEVNGQVVALTDAPGPSPVWRQISPNVPGAFEALIVDAQGTSILRLTRQYSLAPASYTVWVRQTTENLTDTPLKVRWFQFGPGDMPVPVVSYGGDVRRVRFGYLPSPKSDPTRRIVLADRFILPRHGLVKSTAALWPNESSASRELELVWSAMTDRYFAVAIHPHADAASPPTDKRLGLAREITPVVIGLGTPSEALVQRLDSGVRELAPRATLDLSHDLYAGPLAKRQIEAEPGAGALGLPGLVVYTMGGICGFCTFPFLTQFLLWLLHLLHDFLVYDWALAILVLVLIVRGAMHPITKWSQIRMQRFGKQMQDMGPKQKQLQEKYKDDKKQLQIETAKLWKESGVSPTGMMGCLPMLLQTPIWIALYAMLAFAVELRHQPAFFGVFQRLGGWLFMADLSAPDHVISFGRTLVNLPLLGPLESLNALPFLLAFVYWFQQKYLTPPPSANESPEMRQQRIMMKWMMVVIFPLLMYNAPSGLMLYFICNSTIAIVESRHIRAYAKKHGLLEPRKPKPGAPKRKSFLESLQDMQEKRMKLLAEKQRSSKR